MKRFFFLSAAGFGALSLFAATALAQTASTALYVDDLGQSSVKQVRLDGAVTQIASGIAAPRGVAVDQFGHLYVASETAGELEKIGTDGSVTTFETGLAGPEGVTIDAAGNLYVAENSGGTIRKFSPDGTGTVYARGINAPVGLVFDSKGNLFVTTGASTIVKITPSGQSSQFLDLAAQLGPQNRAGIGIAVDSADNLYLADANISDTTNSKLLKISPTAQISTFAAPLDFPLGVAVDSSNNVYVTTSSDGKVVKVTPGGTVSTFASGFASPGGIAVGSNVLGPEIISPADVMATAGQAFSYQIVATPEPANYDATLLPPELTVDRQFGIVYGKLTTPGTYTINVFAGDANGVDSFLPVTITVPSGPGPIITSRTSATGKVGAYFRYQIVVSGVQDTVTNPATFDASGALVSTATLPADLKIDRTTGVLSGIPSKTGSYLINLSAKDNAGTVNATLELTVSADVYYPVIMTPQIVRARSGEAFTYEIKAVQDVDLRDPTVFMIVGNLPPGLGFDGVDLITGTPTGAHAERAAAKVHAVSGGALGSPGSLGTVTVFGTNAHGTTSSTVTFGNPAAAVNISTRLAVGTADNVLIGGFIVQGSAPKQVLVRGRGPSLTAAGVANALTDPTLQLFDSNGVVVASNDNWRDTQEAAITASNLAPTDDRESAVVKTVAPGNYTAIVSGKAGTTGVGIVEVFDLEGTAVPKVVNISTRGVVQTGDNVMIGGFILQGDIPRRVLVRAIGPSLNVNGVPVAGSLQDPVLELHDATGLLITTNDNWKDTQQVDITASGLPPTDDRESATLRTLQPGSYTAIVRGAANATGVALVEAYVLPE